MIEKCRNLICQEHFRSQNFSGTRIFPNMKFVQTFKNYSNINFLYRKKPWNFLYIQRNLGLAYFPHLVAKTWFSKNLPLTPCRVTWKTKDPIPRKLLYGRTNIPYSHDPSGHGQESYKRINQLSGIAADNKNKIQYNLA